MVLDEEGMPLTYEVYPGNTFEGSTVVEMIKRLKEEYEGAIIISGVWAL